MFFKPVILLCLLFNVTISYASSNVKNSIGEVYAPQANELQLIDALIDKAYKNDKLAMIVLGANWCEDSVSLATKLQSSNVKNIIKSHYELLYLDVGYFTNINSVIQKFGRPFIYATPTVLVIDPSTEELINADSMNVWYEADKVSNMDVVSYFRTLAANPRREITKLSSINGKKRARLDKLFKKITDFEQQNSDKINQGFKKLGPLIESNMSGKKSDKFYKLWNEFATYRYTLSRDITHLREQSIRMAKSQYPSEKLVFPQYPKFSWDK